MKILVTGFKAFLGEQLNPSELLSLELDKIFLYVDSLILPVEFAESFNVLKNHLQGKHYDYVIMLGQAAGRTKISLEKIALNWIQTENKDESGKQPDAGKILNNESLALMSKFPVDQVYAELKKARHPVEISFSAGTYVCNDLYFRVCSGFPELKAVFIHVPLIPEQVKEDTPRPSLDYNTQLGVISEIISSLAGVS